MGNPRILEFLIVSFGVILLPQFLSFGILTTKHPIRKEFTNSEFFAWLSRGNFESVKCQNSKNSRCSTSRGL